MSDLTLFTDTTPPPTAGGVTAPVVYGAVIISAVETTWREIRHRFTGIPDLSVTVPPPASAQDATKCTALRTGRRFVRDGHLTMELQVSSGTLGLDGRPLMEGLLRHAAHGLALTRDIVDVSGGDWRWHKNRYGRLAREVGLTPPARAARVIDMGRCPLFDAGAEQVGGGDRRSRRRGRRRARSCRAGRRPAARRTLRRPVRDRLRVHPRPPAPAGHALLLRAGAAALRGVPDQGPAGRRGSAACADDWGERVISSPHRMKGNAFALGANRPGQSGLFGPYGSDTGDEGDEHNQGHPYEMKDLTPGG
ncbi:hypothetical protein ACFT4A_02455 [Streptomyces sp. NPDC057099]|uniref:hypothetical protein n=1 Tax=Streptomyces sp. NPDC057099 TaxID=3346019 RepID=UPI0036366485